MKEKYINKVLNESTISTSNLNSRPALVGLTRATTNLIYGDLVAMQPTSRPVASLYGIKYLNPNDELSFLTGATYSGQYGKDERAVLENITLDNLSTFKDNDTFLYNDVVFKVVQDEPFAGTTETDLQDIINEAVTSSTIRMAPEGAETTKFESGDPEIADAGFIVNKWQAEVKSRKFKTELTVELAQDMESAGFNTPSMLEDLLATQMAEEINKDVMQSLITVSQRFKIVGEAPKGVLDLSTKTSGAEQARDLYRYICEMNASIQRQTSYSATYVVASSRSAAVLASSGWLEKIEGQPSSAYGVLKNGLVVYCDNTSPIEYVVVGVKADYGETEMVGSLFYAPYTEGIDSLNDQVDHMGAYKVINDPDSLQPRIALLMRYALCVNPYTVGIDDEDARIIDASDMDNFIGKSKMSFLLGVKLPKLEV